MTDNLKGLVEFLLGEQPLEGVWFGEKHPTERGSFWWRSRLRAALSAERGQEAVAIRPAVLRFAVEMEKRLRANDHKGGWLGDATDDEWLLGRLRDEVGELSAVFDGPPMQGIDAMEIVHEAADVANFAMMLADRAHSPKPAPVPVPAAPIEARPGDDAANRRLWASVEGPAAAREPVDHECPDCEGRGCPECGKQSFNGTAAKPAPHDEEREEVALSMSMFGSKDRLYAAVLDRLAGWTVSEQSAEALRAGAAALRQQPVVGEEMVERAAIYEFQRGCNARWEDQYEGVKVYWRDSVRPILTAALQQESKS